MQIGLSIVKSYRELQQSWARLADWSFGKAIAPRDDAARGEFISDFISERGLSFPARSADPRRG